MKPIVRVAAVNYEHRQIPSADAFLARVEHFTRVAAEAGADFVTFPEIFTQQILSAEPRRLTAKEGIAKLTEFTPVYTAKLHALAKTYAINIIGGSHLTMTREGVRNIAYVALRDGRLVERHKIHPTPNEASVWSVGGGGEADIVDTDCGAIAVTICYDSEFPELARRLTDQGARIFFVPFCTDDRRGYLRVRYCCQARTIENQCYVVLSGNTGNVPNIDNFDVIYAQSCILTPSDMPFARDGIAAETSENVDAICLADLDLTALDRARDGGTVRNLADRRGDLYEVKWKG